MSYTEPRSIARFARFHEGDTKNIVINGGFFAMSAELRSGHNNNTTCSVFCQVIFPTESNISLSRFVRSRVILRRTCPNAICSIARRVTTITQFICEI